MIFFVGTTKAQAGLYNKISSMFGSNTTEFSVNSRNSQNIPLLKAPTNPKLATGGAEITIVDDSALEPELNAIGGIGADVHAHGSDQISIYVVRKGDNLSQIAKMFDVTVNTILWSNNISGQTVTEGQTLVILPISGVRHTAAKGDTVASIAKKYKSDAEEISQYNDLSLRADLKIGDLIIVPDGEITTPVTTKSKSIASGKVDPYSKTVPPSSYGAPKNPLPIRDVPTGYFARPLAGGTKTQGIHGYNGVDIGAPNGTPLLASAAGTVIVSKNSGWNGGYGNYVVIAHDNGTQTLYAHMSVAMVNVGQAVSKGQMIGKVGSTGKSTGSHVHFEIRGAKNPF